MNLNVLGNLDIYRSGSTEPWSVNVLCALITALKPRQIIETGAFEGRTTEAIYQTLIEGGWGARLTTVEHDEERCKVLKHRMGAWPSYQRLSMELAGGDALLYLKGLPTGSIDFVFLDDDHTAAHVDEEITECERVVRVGGVITGHDVCGPFALDEVFRRHGGIVLPFERFHIAGGLGIIVR